MNYDIEVDSGAMMYIPSFIKNGSGIQKLICAIYTGCFTTLGHNCRR
jgi:hypothetical protein